MAAKGKRVIGLNGCGKIKKTEEIKVPYIRQVRRQPLGPFEEVNSDAVDHEGGGRMQAVGEEQWRESEVMQKPQVRPGDHRRGTGQASCGQGHRPKEDCLCFLLE